jgi:predicted enzyme related to lactoylglutathione lyase
MTLPHSLAPVLHVSDLTRSLNFFTNILGFAEEFRYEDIYAGVHAGNTTLHLSLGGGAHHRPVGGSNVYFFLNSPAEVDAYYATLKERGAALPREPQTYPYCMRDFSLSDPDGNILTFGAETPESVE